MVAAGFVLRLIAGAVGGRRARSRCGSSWSGASARCSWSPESATPSTWTSASSAPAIGRRSTEYSVEYLGYVRSVVVGRGAGRVLPLGVRRRASTRAASSGSRSRSFRSCSRSCGTRCSSNAAKAARRRTSCSPTDRCRCWARCGSLILAIGALCRLTRAATVPARRRDAALRLGWDRAVTRATWSTPITERRRRRRFARGRAATGCGRPRARTRVRRRRAERGRAGARRHRALRDHRRRPRTWDRHRARRHQPRRADALADPPGLVPRSPPGPGSSPSAARSRATSTARATTSTARSATTSTRSGCSPGRGEIIDVDRETNARHLLGHDRRHGPHRRDPRRDLRSHPRRDADSSASTRNAAPTSTRCSSAMEEGDDAYRYSVAWIDCGARGKHLGRGILGRGNHAFLDEIPKAQARRRPHLRAPTARRSPRRSCPPGSSTRGPSARSTRLWYRKARISHRGSIQDIGLFFHPLDLIDEWNVVYGRRGFVQYQFVVPFGQENTVRARRRDAEQREPAVVPRGAQAVRRGEPGNALVPDAGLDPRGRHSR